MLDSIRQRDPGKALPVVVAHAIVRALISLFYSIFFRARSYAADGVPATGPVLVVANHQSFLDPPLLGTAIRSRHAQYVARATLFKFKPFGWALALVNSIPIREDSGDAGAIREILKRLESGDLVILFPEGNRTDDGAMQAFKRGAALLVKRSRCPVVPAAVEGCFDTWPRFNPLPRLWGCPIFVKFGKPISHDELMKDGADAALRRLEREIDAMRLDLRQKIRRQTGGTYPAPGPGDSPFVFSPAASNS